jgi:hypothetical protein
VAVPYVGEIDSDQVLDCRRHQYLLDTRVQCNLMHVQNIHPNMVESGGEEHNIRNI